MFGFIAFGFKIVFAAILGVVLNYVPGNKQDTYKMVEASFFCILGSSIIAFICLIVTDETNYILGFGIIAVIMSSITLTKNKNIIDKTNLFFASISGMIVGLGYIFHASILVVLIYTILHNNEKFLNYLNDNNAQRNDDMYKNAQN